eukprot:812091-Pyramimonas_sp.AAC.1
MCVNIRKNKQHPFDNTVGTTARARSRRESRLKKNRLRQLLQELHVAISGSRVHCRTSFRPCHGMPPDKRPQTQQPPDLKERSEALAARLVDDKTLYNTMITQHKVFVHNESGAFVVKPNQVSVEFLSTYCTEGALVSVKLVKLIVRYIDAYTLKKVSGTDIKGAVSYNAWVDSQAKIGKRLVGLSRRGARRRSTKKTSGTKTKFSAKAILKIASKIKKQRLKTLVIKD